MKWIKNLEMIAQKKEPGTCPFCDSKNTDYGFIVDDEKTSMGHGAVWCNDCHNGYHISRIKISSDMKISDIPKNIKY